MNEWTDIEWTEYFDALPADRWPEVIDLLRRSVDALPLDERAVCLAALGFHICPSCSQAL